VPVSDGAARTFYDFQASFSGVRGDVIDETYVFPNDGGFFQFTWTIDGGDPIKSCAAGDVFQVVGTWQEDPDPPFEDEYDCDDSVGVTDADLVEGQPIGWPLGDYVLDVLLADAANEPISDPNPITEFIGFGSELVTVDVDFVSTP